jgi:DinB family protein
MDFQLTSAIAILERTPQALALLLNGLSDAWIQNNEGEETWSPFDIIGHLVHTEKTDWIVRTELILSNEANNTFDPVDRFAQFEESKGKTIRQLLDELQNLRATNLAALRSRNLKPEDLKKTGIHPVFGEVTLAQLLSTWVAHDLGHIAQISRVMAKQYKDQVGPWRAYLPILDR